MRITYIEPEFSHPVAVEKIPPGGMELSLAANETERRKLAERFGLLELRSLQAKLKLKYTHAGQTLDVSGNMVADMVQECVVTLEPLPSRIEQPVQALYAAPDAEAETPTLLDDQDIEPVENGVIDLGELVAQHLGAAIDPYPRKPGSRFGEAEFGAPAPTTKPFAKLAEFKKKSKE